VRDLNGYLLSFGHNLLTPTASRSRRRPGAPREAVGGAAPRPGRIQAPEPLQLPEEILLHTNEPLGDGVASPHTKGQLKYIQELKKKHGIDYDSHGSYRFVEK
jgi:hypothetical protein